MGGTVTLFCPFLPAKFYTLAAAERHCGRPPLLRGIWPSPFEAPLSICPLEGSLAFLPPEASQVWPNRHSLLHAARVALLDGGCGIEFLSGEEFPARGDRSPGQRSLTIVRSPTSLTRIGGHKTHVEHDRLR